MENNEALEPQENTTETLPAGPVMNTRKNSIFLVIGAGVIFTIILLFQSFGADNYVEEMVEYRKKQDNFLKASPDSPIPDSLRAGFTTLNYFPVDKKFKVSAKFVPHPKYERIQIPQTGGQSEVYIIAGKLEFMLNKTKCSLTAYQPNGNDSKSLFIPFRDQTSKVTTYGGGRYLDVRLIEGRVVLDFNKAYNPYCVYNYTQFACPIPPQENTLPVAVEAGEKDFHIEDLMAAKAAL
jgi:hypothetical protein